MVLAAVMVSVSIYALGAAILTGFGAVPAALYLLFCLGAEINVLYTSCVDCYYYGRQCAFGKGRIAPFLFKQGDPKRFSAKCMSWTDLVPDMLVLLIPFVGGSALLVREFSWTRAVMLAALLVAAFRGNYLVRSRIACKYCKQRELGCPAERFFSKQRPEQQ